MSKHIRRRQLYLALAIALAIVGCDERNADPVETVYTGTITPTQGSSHVVSLGDTANVRVSLVSVERVVLDPAINPATLTYTLNLGRSGTTSCTTTFTTGLRVGDEISFGLGKGDYCLTMSNTGLPADSSVTYSLKTIVKE